MTGTVEHWNRRRFERLALHCGCWLEAEAITVYGRTIDIGRGGLFLRTAVRMPRGSSVEVRLQLPGRIDELSASGTVVWAGNVDGRMGVAVEFSEARDQEALGGFLDRRRAPTAP
jgi:uncharacterized protein (TIGR02266 family)